MLLTKVFAPEIFARALESWTWLDLKNKTPFFASLFGDVFFVEPNGYRFLDTLEGTLTSIAKTKEELDSRLDSKEGQDQFLLGALAMAADRKGLHLKPNEVYDFQIPPVLGGPIDLSHVTVMDFVVSLTIAGQLHGQLKDLPPGSKVSGFTLDGVDLGA